VSCSSRASRSFKSHIFGGVLGVLGGSRGYSLWVLVISKGSPLGSFDRLLYYVTYHMPHIIRYNYSYVTYTIQHIIQHIIFICHMPYTTCHIALTTYHIPHSTQHIPHTTYHIPHSTYHTAHKTHSTVAIYHIKPSYIAIESLSTHTHSSCHITSCHIHIHT
jgi:hypothetical protein